eukprot:scaffold25750_cov146-Isochrysis_galbana.AAC.3
MAISLPAYMHVGRNEETAFKVKEREAGRCEARAMRTGAAASDTNPLQCRFFGHALTLVGTQKKEARGARSRVHKARHRQKQGKSRAVEF